MNVTVRFRKTHIACVEVVHDPGKELALPVDVDSHPLFRRILLATDNVAKARRVEQNTRGEV